MKFVCRQLLGILLSLSFFPYAAMAWDAKAFKPKSKAELKKQLSDLEFEVTQNQGTEQPFKNKYWENKEPGIYVDIVSGEPLFSSIDKYDSGTGWPSFTKPLKKENIQEKEDNSFFSKRTEIRSVVANSHLGHVFDDGPKPTGLRYCMNSAALRFIPVAKLNEEGYSEFLGLFKDAPATAFSVAVFAGGCFWCMQPPFDKLKDQGVIKTLAGYSGGTVDNPSYEQVSHGGTGHLEVVEVTYDPKKISFKKLLETYWKNIDPLDTAGQFCDKGDQYKSAVFTSNESEEKDFLASKTDLEKDARFKGKTATQLLKLKKFYPAEDYHQEYYLKNPIRYRFYRNGCGRDNRLKELWGSSGH